jgi:GMP synthase-like glutamine amidotransferase
VLPVIVYAVTDTFERYQNGDRVRQKVTLEQAAGDVCLTLHYTQLTPRLVRDVRPWAIVHSGSSTPFENYDVRETRPYRRVSTHAPVPQLGICGGHQLLAEFFGGTVASMRPVRAGEPDLNPKYHPGEFKEWGVYEVEVVQPDPLFRGCGKTIRVQEFHRSEVKDPGRDLVVLARTPDCHVQAFRHRCKTIYGVQFHPEEASETYPDGWRILRNFFKIAREAQERKA